MPAIGPFFTGAKQLSIDLAEPVVYLRGSSGDRTTHVLQGEVSIVLTKPMVATQIIIKFVGKSYILWPEGKNNNCIDCEQILKKYRGWAKRKYSLS